MALVPISMRLEAIARRRSGHVPQAQPLTVGVYRRRRVADADVQWRPIELTTKDFDLSVLLLRNVGSYSRAITSANTQGAIEA
jgi:hypothetical protein